MILSELRQMPHLSASSIGDYVECSLLYKFGRIDRLPMDFKADAMIFGSVIHLVLGEYYEEKMIGSKMVLKTYRSIIMKPLTPNMEKLKSVDIGRYRI